MLRTNTGFSYLPHFDSCITINIFDIGARKPLQLYVLVDLKVWCCEDELSTLNDVHQETIRIASQIDDSNFLWRQNVCVFPLLQSACDCSHTSTIPWEKRARGRASQFLDLLLTKSTSKTATRITTQGYELDSSS